MEKEGLSYHEAMLHLARKYGIEVKERELTDKEREEQNAIDAMYAVNEWAVRQFETQLHDTQEGRDLGLSYLYERGVTEEAVREFHLGYCSDKGYSLLNAARKAGFDTEVMRTVGLVSQGNNGLYDKYRGRVIFPIQTTSGKVVGFGARDIKGNSQAKYINSPESEIYKKSNELYGIFQAKNAMSREKHCFLVEGYMDVIGMWQSGLKNVVASSGTALTDGQIALMHRFANRVTVIYDGDSAGIKAAFRGMDMLLSHELDVGVLLLPDGHDPDSFARAHTPEEFRAYVSEHEVDVVRFKTEVLLAEAGSDARRRAQAMNSIVETIACIPKDEAQRYTYIQECSRMLNVPENVLMRILGQKLRERRVNARKEREQQRLTSDIARGADPTTAPALPGGAIEPPKHEAAPAARNPMQQFEREVIRLCVRYAMVDFCDEQDIEGNTRVLSLIQFVAADLAQDDTRFSVDVYARIFKILCEMQPDFEQRLGDFMATLRAEMEEERRRGYDEITAQAMDMRAIAKAEAALEERIAAQEGQRIREFEEQYAASELASHPDDDVRRAAISMLHTPYTLSKYHSQNVHVDTEAERLGSLVPHSIMQWRNAILGERIADVQRQLTQQPEEALQRSLMQQLTELYKMRAEISSFIGDRVVAPRRNTQRP